MAEKEILRAIDHALAALTAARKLLASTAKQTGVTGPTIPSAKKSTSASSPKRGMSEEGRQRIAEAQRKRWAAKKKADKKAARQKS
jgi:hypothetical protein